MSLQVTEDFKPHRYSNCCEISFDVGSIGIVRNTKTFTAFKTKLRSSWQCSMIGIKSFDTMFHLQTCLNTSRVCGSSRLKNLSKSFKLSDRKIENLSISNPHLLGEKQNIGNSNQLNPNS
jgi:hypothetical protein